MESRLFTRRFGCLKKNVPLISGSEMAKSFGCDAGSTIRSPMQDCPMVTVVMGRIGSLRVLLLLRNLLSGKGPYTQGFVANRLKARVKS
jgi:hypothetical protein